MPDKEMALQRAVREMEAAPQTRMVRWMLAIARAVQKQRQTSGKTDAPQKHDSSEG